ncbi:fumarylacetoacetate hydrolase-like protein [Glonium stellatum]|uniref:Fumarylacetoacetate hydrolase-like protein n=1 Tax=Glonium stellatum TaxID=574774 RepID=A0A8E2JTU0_9PEZI|nr:fumarylacetoacetate hydrolase-like protein [Glonium stellatum]
MAPASLTNYIAYVDSGHVSRIGHLESSSNSIQPLAFKSGTPLSNLYQVIEAGEKNIAPFGDAIPFDTVKLLPPISGRDVLAVGKNYAAHAVEFNKSGYDRSDQVDQPTHTVIFTKRATSIIASGEEILPHPKFTKTLDYEGEIGVIIGKAGFQISEGDAMDHVWGYTIINDVTARERQRDHKQFFLGKSADTFCPMGPIAVPARHLPKVLRVQTYVNGDKRQEATTEDLIFSIASLIVTLSEGQTLQPGDVIATGTPAGVGFGQKPPTFLKPGDEVSISVTGLGTLRNKIATFDSVHSATDIVRRQTNIQMTNAAKSPNGANLSSINGKTLYYRNTGNRNGQPIVFVHGLGGTMEYWTPIITALSLNESHSLHLFDLEGHGISPTSPLSTLSISSFAEDVKGIFQHANITSGATLMAHSMGCLIALAFAISNPGLVERLILIGPPPSPLPEAASNGSHARASLARSEGMPAVVDSVVTAGTSSFTKARNPLALIAVRMSLLGQDPEGYAKACSALAGATEELDIKKIEAQTLIVTGDEDKVSPLGMCQKMKARMKSCRDVKVLENTGHWHAYESIEKLADSIRSFMT